jgi:hypothetical protein
LNFSLIKAACVPLPAPGGPNRMSRMVSPCSFMPLARR